MSTAWAKPAVRGDSFREHRFETLGLSPRRSAAGPDVVVCEAELRGLEERFRDADGCSLGGLVKADVQARIFSEVGRRCPDANALLASALERIDQTCPWIAALARQMLVCVVPLAHQRYGRPFRRGFSHARYLGVVFTTFEERSAQPGALRAAILAVDLAHEIGHQVLMLYQMTDRLISSPLDAPVYSSVRRTARPAIMSLHSCVASAYMIEMCRALPAAGHVDHRVATFCSNSVAELLAGQDAALEGLEASCRFTALGRAIVDELRNHAEQIIRPQLDSSPSLSYFGLLAP